LIIDITPAPFFARLERSDQRVLRRVEVPRRVRVFRIVAASDVAADQAQAEADPRIADRETVLAAFRARLDGANLIEMQAAVGHYGVRECS
jgi:hypothetical protein